MARLSRLSVAAGYSRSSSWSTISMDRARSKTDTGCAVVEQEVPHGREIAVARYDAFFDEAVGNAELSQKARKPLFFTPALVRSVLK